VSAIQAAIDQAFSLYTRPAFGPLYNSDSIAGLQSPDLRASAKGTSDRFFHIARCGDYSRPALFHKPGFDELVHVRLSEIDPPAYLGMSELVLFHQGIDEAAATTQVFLELLDRQNILVHRPKFYQICGADQTKKGLDNSVYMYYNVH
jgi:hypothetical protein